MGRKKKVTELPLIELVTILDRSGSMGNIAKEAIGMYNNLLSEQRAIPGKMKMTSVLFDDKYDILHDNVPMEDVPDLTDKTFVPRGMTALYDAVGKTIQTVSERIENTPEIDRPKKVICFILTDGQENNSKEFTAVKVKEMIDTKSKADWEFIYLASDLNQFNDNTFGSTQNSYNFMATGNGMGTVAHYTNSTVTLTRNMVYSQDSTDIGN